MNEIYIHISITEYGNGRIDCCMVQSVGDGPLEITKLDVPHALKLMWELVLAGGHREVCINRFNRDIVTRNAYIILPG